MEIPTASAVLLLHNAHGGFPVSGASGLSGQAAHTLAYDGRKNRYEGKGGCDREPTERDRRLSAGRALADGARSHMDYDARQGRWAAKGAGSIEDCTYWGQPGPLSRGEIEADMLACGGCYLKSVVSVDRRYARDLALDSKAAFEELMRNNWQKMMVAAGVAEREADVRWYACYHTDAPNSLHVHVTTWAADGRIAEGWHPSARATREQKAILYRDAYAQVRLERDRERDYYRMLLPKLAAAEMGAHVPEKTIRRLEEKAALAGVEPVPLRQTLSGPSAAEVEREAVSVAERLAEGRGRKSSNWQLQSQAGKVVNAIRRGSPAFAGAMERYRELVEAKADMAGLAADDDHDRGPSRPGKAAPGRGEASEKVVLRERRRFVKRDMDDLMCRVRNQVIRAADPGAQLRDLAREQVDRVRHRLVTESLDGTRAGITPDDAERLAAVYREASEGGISPSAATEAARIVAASESGQRAAREAADRIVQASGGKVGQREALGAVREQMVARIENAIRWRFADGRSPSPRPSREPGGAAQADRAVPQVSFDPIGAAASIAAAIVRERGEDTGTGGPARRPRAAASEREMESQ